MEGCNPATNDRCCPTDNVTRGHMAAFRHRALDPAHVQDLSVTLGGGGSEIDVSWDPNSETGTDFYNAYFSEFPEGHIRMFLIRTSSGQMYFIDWPREETVGKTCYLFTAVDVNEKEGPASTEACFDPGA